MTISGPPLTDRDFAVVQRYIDRLVEETLSLGLSLEIEHDFDTFAKIRGKMGWVYPSFDPAVSDLEGDAVWVRAITRQGDTVGISAGRVFETWDFWGLVKSQRIWYRAPQPDPDARFDVAAPAEARIEGAVAHVGGLYVEPTWRKQGLSRILPWVIRGLLLRNFAVEHVTSLVFENIAKSGLPRGAYGFTATYRIIEGYFPPTAKAECVYLCHIARADILARMEEELSAPLQVAAASAVS